MKKRLLHHYLTVTLCLALLPAIVSAAPQDQQTRPVFDFTSVAKKSIPAVVSVKTKGKSKASSFGGQLDPFEDDIWERFFGIPRRNKETPQQQPSLGQASGFIVSSDGYILTNGHVVQDADEIMVLLGDGREFQAKLVGADSNTDVAILKIEGQNFPYLGLGDSAKAEVGQWVAAIGNPFGLQATLTAGVVSAKGRSNLDLAALEDFIQTDAAINRGNSGGPLLNLDGEVIGMNTALASNTGGYIGIGFAIPSNMIKYVMNELVNNGKVTRGYLGVVLQQVTYDVAMALGLKNVEGALIAEVQDNSPAAAAGLKRGDVIIKFNDRQVDSAGGLRTAVSLMPPGSALTLTVLRNKELVPLNITVGTFPEGAGVGLGAKTETALGIKVQNLTADLAQKFGYGGQKGVVVTEVSPDSPLALIGLKAGSLILEINQKPVHSVEDFNQVASEVKKGSHVLLLVRQDQVTRYVALTIK